MKIDPPLPYDGSSDFDAFERWTYAVNAWFEITEFPKRHRVRQMLAFMRGRAQQYYMTFVAPDVKAWTVETVGQGLFNYCFPPAFRRQTRLKFNELMQGKQTICEYLRNLRSIAACLPDMNEFQLTQKYWDGANSYLRLKWTENSYTPEFSTLEELEIAAEHFENAEHLRIFELRRGLCDAGPNSPNPVVSRQPTMDIPQRDTDRRLIGNKTNDAEAPHKKPYSANGGRCNDVHRQGTERSCQDPARQATASSVQAGPGQIWIGLGLRLLRGAHLLFSPTLNAFHMARVPRRKTSFHCVYVLGHNLAFVLS